MELEELINNAINSMRKTKHTGQDVLTPEITSAGAYLLGEIIDLSMEERYNIMKQLHKELPISYPNVTIRWYSVLIEIYLNKEIFFEYVKYINENRNIFSVNTQYFLFYQLEHIYFLYSNLDSFDTKKELWCFFKGIVDSFAKEIHTSLKPISKETRNDDIAIVITSQLIDIQHGPTKTTLDRCKALITFGKKVLLINTVELLSQVGKFPLISYWPPTPPL